MRNGHLEDSNPLTNPDERSVRLLGALITSSFVLSKAGIPCSIRRAGDLLFLHDARDQKSEASKFLHAVASRGPKGDDTYWVHVRRDLLWLWSWEPFESMSTSKRTGNGIFGAVDRQFIETELLREILTATRMFGTNCVFMLSSTDVLLQDTISRVLSTRTTSRCLTLQS